MKDRIPYVLGRIIDFRPLVTEVKPWRFGQVGRKGNFEEDTNHIIMNIKDQAKQPMIKLVIQFFN
jgi:hypothetical protein